MVANSCLALTSIRCYHNNSCPWCKRNIPTTIWSSSKEDILPSNSTAHPLFTSPPCTKSLLFLPSIKKFRGLQKVEQQRLGVQKVLSFSYGQNSEKHPPKQELRSSFGDHPSQPGCASGPFEDRFAGVCSCPPTETHRDQRDVPERRCVRGDGRLRVPGKEAGEAAAGGRETG